MKTLRNLALALATTLAGCAASPDAATTPAPTGAAANAPAPGKYAQVNGVNMYYEVHGTGRPLVLIHGAFCTIEECFAPLIPGLAAERQVIAVELQGHGHTPDIDRPLTAANLAGDVLALLDQLGIQQADVLGYSLGGAVGFELALEHPDRVGKLVVTGYGVSPEGLHPGIIEGMDFITPEVFAGSPWEKAYLAAAPDPSQWPGLIEKIKAFSRTHVGWSLETVAAIPDPVLVVLGDSDIVKPEHAVEIFRALGGGVAGDVVGLPEDRLAILPGTTHVTLIQRGEWLAEMVNEFLGP